MNINFNREKEEITKSSDNKTIFNIDGCDSLLKQNQNNIFLATLEIKAATSVEEPKNLSHNQNIFDNFPITRSVNKSEKENMYPGIDHKEAEMDAQELKEKKYKWYFSDIDRAGAEEILNKAHCPGSFLIRRSTHPNAPFTFSLFSIKKKIKHSRIKYSPGSGYTLDEVEVFAKVKLLVDFYQSSKKLHACQLEDDESQGPWMIFRDQIELVNELKSGCISDTWKACYEKHTLVALIGLCLSTSPFILVFEYMDQGSLLKYLEKQKNEIPLGILISSCRQVCE
ncbi:hypothetical protein HZS_3256, partial [Henneguya salminicola]